MIEPFSIAIAKSVLDDLQDRLARTRWTDDFANDDWGYGADAAYIRELAAYWRDPLRLAMPAGGHFAAMEEPEALAADIREFFSDKRAREG
jgi:hypothetical protein